MHQKSVNKTQKQTNMDLLSSVSLQPKTVNQTGFNFSTVDRQSLLGNQMSNTVTACVSPHSNYKFSKIPISFSSPPLIKAKLKIGQPNDKYEKEADRVAEQVMRMPQSQFSAPLDNSLLATSATKQSESIQRVCTSCLEDEALVQTKISGGEMPELSSSISYSIYSLQGGGGQRLSRPERSFFEPRFGYDFSHVRIHSDSKANQSAQSLQARAYTLGRDIVFGAGQYAPETNNGRRLLAHELTHIVQQSGGKKGASNSIKRVNKISVGPELNGLMQRKDAPAVPLGPIDKARNDVLYALRSAVGSIKHAIDSRDTHAGLVPHDVEEALCRYFPKTRGVELEKYLARVEPMINWIPNIEVRKIQQPALVTNPDKALLDKVTWPAQAMLRRGLPTMAPGNDYIALFPSWYANPSTQATQFLHEAYHYSWIGMTHVKSTWNDAFAWQGFVSDLGGLKTAATLQNRYPACPGFNPTKV